MKCNERIPLARRSHRAGQRGRRGPTWIRRNLLRLLNLLVRSLAPMTSEICRHELLSLLEAEYGKRRVRVVVLGTGSSHDVLHLFFDRLGWLDADSPQVAVVAANTADELNQILAGMRKDGGASIGGLPLLVASRDEAVGLSEQGAESRPWAAVAFPGRHQRMVEALAELLAGRPAEPARARELGTLT